MNKLLPKIKSLPFVSISLPASKSESNRLLILKALSHGNLVIENLSEANDTLILQNALASKTLTIDVADAGTAMRFLLAYLCVKNEHKILQGTARMHLRPIADLVEALLALGFRINYLAHSNFPPLEILPIQLSHIQSEVDIHGAISSQYISALMLIGWHLPNGLRINIQGLSVSKPYIQLTASLMLQAGLKVQMEGSSIIIPNQQIVAKTICVYADWTNASYWYAIVALGEVGEKLFLENLSIESSQGDKEIVQIAEQFGVQSTLNNLGVFIEKVGPPIESSLHFDFVNHPDLAQTIIVLCAAMNLKATFKGLSSLKIKETDRVLALQNELEKCGIKLVENENGVYTIEGKMNSPIVPINTYNDHRMAMAFAPLCRKVSIEIENPEVVQKSYPNFWEEVQKLS